MSAPRLLVIEGNSAHGRALLTAAGGRAPSTGYAELLRDLMPGAVVDICFPADPGANLPGKEGVEGYDGAVITGSALHVYQRGPAVDPQIELAKAVLAAKTPLFGSCWGLQVITVATGGSVRKNPKGREIGFGRRIRLDGLRTRPSDVCRQGRSVQCRDRASRRGRIGRARHAGALQQSHVGRAIGGNPRRRSGGLGHAISSRIYAGRYRGDLAPLRQDAGR